MNKKVKKRLKRRKIYYEVMHFNQGESIWFSDYFNIWFDINDEYNKELKNAYRSNAWQPTFKKAIKSAIQLQDKLGGKEVKIFRKLIIKGERYEREYTFREVNNG